MIDPSTELASGFTAQRYRDLRLLLDAAKPNSKEWEEVLEAFGRRIRERFLKPIRELARHDHLDVLPNRPGFAILALDCLLIDTIQSFREGRISTGEVSPAHSFKSFLRSAANFGDFKSRDRDDFFQYVRNGLLHNGETRKDWKIRIDVPALLTRDAITGTRTINRRLFHAGVVREFRLLCGEVKSGSVEARTQFLRRMDALAGLPICALPSRYFAYGSNLLESEIRKDAPDAQTEGMAFLPGHRLTFNKHSVTRKCDAANIEKDSGRVVWGVVYRMHDQDRKQLGQREKGYREISDLVVYLTSADAEDVTPVEVFTFQAEQPCARGCGPDAAYLGLIVEGARSRSLPSDYTGTLESQLGALTSTCWKPADPRRNC